jgi:hypothetical protein
MKTGTTYLRTLIVIVILGTHAVLNRAAAFETNCLRNVIFESGDTGKYLSDLVVQSAN